MVANFSLWKNHFYVAVKTGGMIGRMNIQNAALNSKVVHDWKRMSRVGQIV